MQTVDDRLRADHISHESSACFRHMDELEFIGRFLRAGFRDSAAERADDSHCVLPVGERLADSCGPPGADLVGRPVMICDEYDAHSRKLRIVSGLRDREGSTDLLCDGIPGKNFFHSSPAALTHQFGGLRVLRYLDHRVRQGV